MANYFDCAALMGQLTSAEMQRKLKQASGAEAYNEFLLLLNGAPVADVAPVVHGRWEYIPQTLNTLSQFRCPFCRWWSLDPSIDGAYNYCPNCGARMDGDSNG